jgi:hypothetical protein
MLDETISHVSEDSRHRGVPRNLTILYLVQSQGGKLRQICVPQAWQERIRQALTDYHKMQKLIEEVSELEWKRLQERKR